MKHLDKIKRLYKAKLYKKCGILLVCSLLSGSIPVNAQTGMENVPGMGNAVRLQADGLKTGDGAAAPATGGSVAEVSTGSAVTGSAVTGSVIDSPSAEPSPSAGPSPSVETSPSPETNTRLGIKAEVNGKKYTADKRIYIVLQKKAKSGAKKNERFEAKIKLEAEITRDGKKITKDEYDNYIFTWYKKQDSSEETEDTKISSQRKASIKITKKGLNLYYCKVQENRKGDEAPGGNSATPGNTGLSTGEDVETPNEDCMESEIAVIGYKNKADVRIGGSIDVGKEIFGIKKADFKRLECKTKNQNVKKYIKISKKKGKIEVSGYCKNIKMLVKLKDMPEPVTIIVNAGLPRLAFADFKIQGRKLSGYFKNVITSKNQGLEFMKIQVRFRIEGEKKYSRLVPAFSSKFENAVSKKKKGIYINQTPLLVRDYKARAVYRVRGSRKKVRTEWTEARIAIKK